MEHYYPRSSGLVLIAIGKAIDELCRGWVRIRGGTSAIEEVRAAKLARFGEHPSRLPNYQAPWKLAREKALRKQAVGTALSTSPKG